MPRKAYIADLKALSPTSGVKGISSVRAGDDDGEFRFKVGDGSGGQYEISGLIPDVSDYPTDHMFHIFVADDSAPSHVGATLDRLPNTSGMSLAKLLEVVSRSFAAGIDGDQEMVDSQVDNGASEEEDDFEDEEEEEGDFFGGEGRTTSSGPQVNNSIPSAPGQPTPQLRKRIRSDLRHARAAGFKIGHHGALLEGASCYVSISCRVSKLGISEEAIQAWQLEPSEYLIFLMYFPNGYKSAETIIGYDASTARRNVEFRVGLSHSYKPTLKEAITAFTKLTVEEEARAEALQAKAEATKGHPRGFRNTFISRPLNDLLNERLPTVIKYRYLGMHWTGAEQFYNDHQGKSYTMTGLDYVENKYMDEEPVKTALPVLVNDDHISDSNHPHSFPLVGMQFLLRHFVRCTEFCLVCHCKLEDDLEALKPYVCDKPLCLYQYMSLGFGPSIEHEIISQPYVLDLLVSFCYQAAQCGKLSTFPSGLSLNVPPAHLYNEIGPAQGHPYAQQYGQPAPTPAVTPWPEDQGHTAKFNEEARELLFQKGVINPLRVGDWIAYSIPGQEGYLYHCRIQETHLFPVVRVTDPISKPTANYAAAPAGAVQQVSKPATKPIPSKQSFEVKFHIYSVNFDDLTDPQKRGAMLTQLELLPSVLDLKHYLTRNRTATLATWTDRISPTASGILRWIIASNRACIVQVDDLDSTGKKTGEERLYGMDGWVQFRFAMGAPDKERRFMSSVQATQSRLNLKHPTLFAWHGSPLYNWHGIIREGLHFKDVQHGRAFGNGCYHSLDYNTSAGYSGFHSGGYRQGYSSAWPASELKIVNAMALNEIVNAPAEFVSRTPHLVVAQLDWIQTRYLFVQCQGERKPALDSTMPGEIHDQDPGMTPKGPKGSIVVPLSAMPKNRRGKEKGKNTKGKRKMKPSGDPEDPILIDIDDDDSASIATLDEDRDLLLDDDDEAQPSRAAPSSQTVSTSSQGKGKEPTGFMSGLKSLVSKGSSKSSKPLTDFVPGSLDYSTLPLLAPPAWSTSSATKRLQGDFQALLKVQESTPLHELGWYTDPEQFNNVYQWIIEFHSFESKLPLAKQMKDRVIKSVVMEMRFGPEYPMSPPFVRVIRPRFMNFMAGGGGHVTAGGSICMELLTNSGWSAVSSMESVLLQVRLAMSSTDPRPAQLEGGGHGRSHDYAIGEAIEAYIRACQVHGWTVPANFREQAMGGASASGW
ncbi:hypothetical protein EJ08DRAFT_663262 [Tothia fuscella]|uniref:UBC core domain-containing protein n=1 Tax=Tothia fuscella TaxID=1048955 RepID=A0A9P4NM17_9PEZI|nr:hypothetical protein EJ08DRAFT_663262 [Tothia fuscella]